MPSSTMEIQSKKQRLVDLGHAITNKARSQRFFRASKTKAIWKNGVNKARRHWNQVRKNKRSTRRETVFDSMYPIGHISSPIPLYMSSHILDYTPETSPIPPQIESNRNSATPSVTLTTPTPSNSQKDQGKRQTVYGIHQAGAAPSPLFYDRPEARPSSVLFPHPVASVVGASPCTPYSAHSSSNYDGSSDDGSDEWSNRSTARSKYILPDYTPGSTPHTAQFPGQVNPSHIAQKRQSEELKRLSHNILDGHPPSDRDQLFSQRERGARELTLPTRSASMPIQAPSTLRPGNVATRPMTTLFAPGDLSPVQESPEPSSHGVGLKRTSLLPHIPYTGGMDGVRMSICAIAGSAEEPQQSATHGDAAAARSVAESPIGTPLTDGFTQGPQIPILAFPGTSTMHCLRESISGISGNATETSRPIAQDDTALAMLEGKLPPVREPSQIADSEVDAQMKFKGDAYPRRSEYTSIRYESYQPGKKLKGRPVPAAGMGRSRPTTPATPQRSSKGKQAADSSVEKSLARARQEVIKNHKRLTRMLDGAGLTTPASISSDSWTTDSVSERSDTPNCVPLGLGIQYEQPTAPLEVRQPSAVTRKPVAKQCSQKRPDTAKPLPQLPQSTKTTSRPQSSTRITILEQRILALETQLARKGPVSAAAAGARAAATLHSAMVAGSSVPRGPHRARPSRKRDIHHDQAPAKEPSAGSILKDMVKGRFF